MFSIRDAMYSVTLIDQRLAIFYGQPFVQVIGSSRAQLNVDFIFIGSDFINNTLTKQTLISIQVVR